MEIIKLQQFQSDFNLAIENFSFPKIIIDNEIQEAKHFVDKVPANLKLFRKQTTPSHSHRGNRIFNLEITDFSKNIFNKAFYGFMLNGDFKTDILNESDLFVIEQASEFYKYYKWLNELLDVPQKAEKKISLSHKQKLLALHYLGLNTSKYENTKTAKILSEILELSEDNTRIFLSYLSGGKNEVRTKTNLEKVNQLFEKQGLTEISDNIKADIKKL